MIQPSQFAKNIGFSLCTYLDSLATVKQNTELSRIWMLKGDPVTYGQDNIKMSEEGYQIVRNSIREKENHSYIVSIGVESARKAVIKHFGGGKNIDASDVILTSGVNMGLLYCLNAICNPGENILVPDLGYPFYDNLAPGRGVQVRKYKLNKQKDFQIDLESVRAIADDKTKFIYIINPSNPMGSIFSKQHLLDLLKVTEELKIIVVADEVYHGMQFEKGTFHSIGHLTQQTPVITLCGLEKTFCVPGWATAWLILYDPKKLFGQIKVAFHTVASLFLHTNVFLQKSLEPLLDALDGANFCQKFMPLYKQNHDYIISKCENNKWLKAYPAQGTFYITVQTNLSDFDDINSDTGLARKLIEQQNVNLIPISPMGNFCGLRLLTFFNKQKYDELFIRLERFYQKHIAKK